jgi:hypothetical protein
MGEIHILVNCAGIQRRAPAVQFPESDWDDVSVYLNLRSACFVLSLFSSPFYFILYSFFRLRLPLLRIILAIAYLGRLHCISGRALFLCSVYEVPSHPERVISPRQTPGYPRAIRGLSVSHRPQVMVTLIPALSLCLFPYLSLAQALIPFDSVLFPSSNETPPPAHDASDSLLKSPSILDSPPGSLVRPCTRRRAYGGSLPTTATPAPNHPRIRPRKRPSAQRPRSATPIPSMARVYETCARLLERVPFYAHTSACSG